jgi:hypothetical protein
MFSKYLYLLSPLLVKAAFAQNATSTSVFVAPGLPTDAPVSGDYTGDLRPRAHFSPPQGFMVSFFVCFDLVEVSLTLTRTVSTCNPPWVVTCSLKMSYRSKWNVLGREWDIPPLLSV